MRCTGRHVSPLPAPSDAFADMVLRAGAVPALIDAMNSDDSEVFLTHAASALAVIAAGNGGWTRVWFAVLQIDGSDLDLMAVHLRTAEGATTLVCSCRRGRDHYMWRGARDCTRGGRDVSGGAAGRR